MIRSFSLNWKISSSVLRFFPRDFLIKHAETVNVFYISIYYDIIIYYNIILYQVGANIIFSSKVLTIY